jgi:hypothetical protein
MPGGDETILRSAAGVDAHPVDLPGIATQLFGENFRGCVGRAASRSMRCCRAGRRNAGGIWRWP